MSAPIVLGVGLITAAGILAVIGSPRDTLSPWAIVIALVMPIAGIVIAIIVLAQGRGAHGAAVLLTSMVGWVLAAVIWL